MKLKIFCPQCPKKDDALNDGDWLTAEVRDDGLYDVTCDQYHRSIVYLKNPKYEVLFDFGAMALLDGYTREAIASMAAAMERFLEFYIKVILLKYGVSNEECKRAWKRIASQSERQLGAFFFLYLLENKKEVEFIGDKYLKFRNDVIHKGYIPSYDEVVDYGEQVLRFITSVASELRSTNPDCVRQVKNQNVHEMLSTVPPGVVAGSGFMTTLINLAGINLAGINLATNEKEPVSFQRSLERFRVSRQAFWSNY